MPVCVCESVKVAVLCQISCAVLDTALETQTEREVISARDKARQKPCAAHMNRRTSRQEQTSAKTKLETVIEHPRQTNRREKQLFAVCFIGSLIVFHRQS